MTQGQRFKALCATVACVGVAMAGMLLNSPLGKAEDRGDDSNSRIEQGFEIAPVDLNLEGKNRALVGLEAILDGGRDFGELVPPPSIGSAHIISRNLTPTPKTGLPEGDHMF